MIFQEAGIKKGSGTPHEEKVANLTKEQVQKIAEKKMEDLNAVSIEAAMNTIKGTARSMGITVTGMDEEGDK
jgi:large subunit ribosomal protein L11